MMCEHKTFCCTNGVFFCLTCGAEIPNPYEGKTETKTEDKPAKKKGGKAK